MDTSSHAFSAVVFALSARLLVSFSLGSFADDPAVRIEDAYKWLYQAALGGEHAVPDEDAARAWLEGEWASLGPSLPGEKLVVPLRPDGAVVRLNLRPYRDRGGRPDYLLSAFLAGARSFEPDRTLFRTTWDALGEELAARPFGSLSRTEWVRLDAETKPEGYPAVHHSAAYARAKHPAYRVLPADEAERLVRSLGSPGESR